MATTWSKEFLDALGPVEWKSPTWGDAKRYHLNTQMMRVEYHFSDLWYMAGYRTPHEIDCILRNAALDKLHAAGWYIVHHAGTNDWFVVEGDIGKTICQTDTYDTALAAGVMALSREQGK